MRRFSYPINLLKLVFALDVVFYDLNVAYLIFFSQICFVIYFNEYQKRWELQFVRLFQFYAFDTRIKIIRHHHRWWVHSNRKKLVKTVNTTWSIIILYTQSTISEGTHFGHSNLPIHLFIIRPNYALWRRVSRPNAHFLPTPNESSRLLFFSRSTTIVSMRDGGGWLCVYNLFVNIIFVRIIATITVKYYVQLLRSTYIHTYTMYENSAPKTVFV